MVFKMGFWVGFVSFLIGSTYNAPLYGFEPTTEAPAEVPAGTIINKNNIDTLKSAIFEGRRISDLLPDRIVWQIRNHGLKIMLAQSTPGGLPMDPRVVQMTEKYKGTASVDPQTFMIENYIAGVPFPEIDSDDPLAGVKVIWNFIFGLRPSDQFNCAFSYLLIDGTTGLDRIQEWRLARYYLRGRNTSLPHTLGDGTIRFKQLLFATFPHDVKGLGTYVIRHHTPKLDDIWAYIRTVRRVRRLSGGAWIDPIGGTDQLQDDLDTFNAQPSWYKGFKLLGTTHVLAPANSASQLGQPGSDIRYSLNPKGSTHQERFPRIDLSGPPYWNPNDVWEVRPVHVVEMVPPEYHPYSKRTNWFDTKVYSSYFSETYDRKGDFWKWLTFGYKSYELADGFIDPATGKTALFMYSVWGAIIDYQRLHATWFNVPPGCKMNDPSLTEDQFAVTQLEAAGR